MKRASIFFWAVLAVGILAATGWMQINRPDSPTGETAAASELAAKATGRKRRSPRAEPAAITAAERTSRWNGQFVCVE